ncbi:LysR family transcriptional regulator [Pseudonocardia xishanensis]|uniref:LysR family transcriptional regulator n=1 Tax=Pseudonocardia xishanensis TaxID=630995 RepID=A0ABP8RUW0_9PSEU
MRAELRHVRAFLAIAEAGTITRAAAALGVGQPALSRTLARLEGHLGVRLVDRSTHHLALTAAGTAYRERALRAVEAVDALLDPDRLGEGLHEPLRLGYAWSALGARTPELLRRWRTTRPGIPLELVQHDTADAGLGAGLAHAVIVRGAVLRGRGRPPGTRAARLPDEHRVAALPENDVLAAGESVTLAELAERTVALNELTGTTTPGLWPAGARPAVTRVGSTAEWLVAIASGEAVGVTAEATAELHRFPGVRYVPVADAPPLPVHLVWPDPPTHPGVPDLVDTVLAVTAGQ